MTEAVQNHIGSLNWGYRVALREKKVTYENAYGQFIGPHRIKVMVHSLRSFFWFVCVKLWFGGWGGKEKVIILKKVTVPVTRSVQCGDFCHHILWGFLLWCGKG